MVQIHKKNWIRNTISREKIGVAPILEKLVDSCFRGVGVGHVMRRPIYVPVRSLS